MTPDVAKLTLGGKNQPWLRITELNLWISLISWAYVPWGETDNKHFFFKDMCDKGKMGWRETGITGGRQLGGQGRCLWEDDIWSTTGMSSRKSQSCENWKKSASVRGSTESKGWETRQNLAWLRYRVKAGVLGTSRGELRGCGRQVEMGRIRSLRAS